METQTTPPSSSSAANDSFKNSIWVNPKNPGAARLKKNSSDTRYVRLYRLAKSLTSSFPNSPSDIADALTRFSDDYNGLSEQDAVILLNSMENHETAVICLRWVLQNVKINRATILYNVTMKVMRKCRNWDGAYDLLMEMVESDGRVSPDNITVSTMISCARYCDLPEKAIDLFERMPELGLKPDDITYSAMIDAYGRSGNIDMALNLFDRAHRENWKLDAIAFSTVIRVYGNSGNYDGALNVFEEMKALGVKPNSITYNMLLDSMGRAGRPWLVRTIYREMIETAELIPNRTTYAALIRSYSRSRYSDDALAVYKETKARGMELNVVLYNSLLAMCADIGLMTDAIEIFEDMKRTSNGCRPDSWTYSSLITIYSCRGDVEEAEKALDEMVESGFDPNIFVLTSLIQCYGKAKQIDKVVSTFDHAIQLGIVPDDRFCGCLLNVMTQTPKAELDKVATCIERSNAKLGSLVRHLIEEIPDAERFKLEAEDVLGSLSKDVTSAFCNCLIDICINLNLLERACTLLDIALRLDIYNSLQSRSSTQWSLHVKSLSLGAALTALHVWMNDLVRALEAEEEFPTLLGIHTGHGRHKYSERGLAIVFESHLRELNAPFHESPDKVGWFLTTKSAAKKWLESRRSKPTAAVTGS